ncbi:MAG: hypothetical protein CVU65_05755 [Deltaproteobacteria bacterium HGW-Deltaproteobacteria-22]|nr:MAG: hypothetical protein CVU65_05755 [Deltaproteobacteria bacterium HGW-Deltaproteobacteria-22]
MMPKSRPPTTAPMIRLRLALGALDATAAAALAVDSAFSATLEAFSALFSAVSRRLRSRSSSSWTSFCFLRRSASSSFCFFANFSSTSRRVSSWICLTTASLMLFFWFSIFSILSC